MKELYSIIGITFIIRSFAAISAFLVTVVVSRSLGPEESGYYFLAFSIAAILSSFSRMGLDNTVVRFIGNDANQARSVSKQAILLVGMGSIFTSCILYFFADSISQEFFYKPNLSNVLKPISLGVLGLSMLTITASILQGLQKQVESILVSGVILNFLLIITLALFKPVSSVSVAKLYGILSLITALIGFSYSFYYQPSSGNKSVHLRTIFRSCTPLWIVMITQQLFQWSGQIVGGIYLDTTSVALLATSQRTAMLLYFVTMVVNIVIAPRFAEFHAQGKFKEIENMAIDALKFTTIIAFPFFIIIILFPYKIMNLFGSGFIEGGSLLRIMAIGQFINLICGSVGLLLIMSGFERYVMNINIVSGILTLSIVWLMTNLYGMIGTAIGIAIGVAFQNFLTVFYVKKLTGFNILEPWRFH